MVNVNKYGKSVFHCDFGDDDDNNPMWKAN